jgi:hypothetical protein
MKLSFGMIFSIILIIFFVGFAFFVIGQIFKGKCDTDIGLFFDELESRIDDSWRGTRGSTPFKQSMCDEVEAICFVDFNEQASVREEAYFEFSLYDNTGMNVFLWPTEASKQFVGFQLDHLNISSTTINENPYCIINKDGKVSLVIEKNFGEVQPTIKRG